MRAGRLRNLVTLQQKQADSPPTNSLGEEEYTWTDLAQIWAAIEPLRGREFFEAAQRQVEIDTRITIRYRSDVTEAMRVMMGSTVYNIQAVIDVENRHEQLQLMCVKGTGDG